MPKFESFEDWIEVSFGTQSGLAEKLGCAANTISQWITGKSRIKGEMVGKIRALGYDGPLPDAKSNSITREDLETLRRDLRAHQGWVREELGKDIQALGAMLQELLRRTEHLK